VELRHSLVHRPRLTLPLVFCTSRASLPRQSGPDGSPHHRPTHARLGYHVLALATNPPRCPATRYRRLASDPFGPRSNNKRTPHLPTGLSFVRCRRYHPLCVACTCSTRPLAARVVQLTPTVSKPIGRSFFLS
jgi:hypothetical protein